MRRILITGSRDWIDRDVIFDALREQFELHGPFVLVHGDARGADRMAAEIVSSYGHGCRIESHPAEWRPYGIYNPQAGLLRNTQMIALGADVCLAFIRSGSRGATDCASRAEAAGIETRRFE